jgi:UPF0755 protein
MNSERWGKLVAFILRNIKRILVLFAVLLVLGSVAYLAYDFAFEFFTDDSYLTYDENGEKMILNIPEGSTGKEIAELLKENGLIDNATFFRWKAQLTGASSDFQYGTYTFVKGMHYQDIVEVLQSGSKAEGVKITIIEGWTIENIADYLQDNDICLREDFIKACESTAYDFDYYDGLTDASERRHLLEGYLHPDTYEIIPANGVEAIVKKLLRSTELLLEERKDAIEKSGYTVDQILTMASVVEREAALENDRNKVARVLYNRLDEGLPWGLNCTVLYALGRESAGADDVTIEDTEVDSGYNTYLHAGFPTGPICNPSEASIDAVLNPASGSWLYFVLDNEETGELYFTSSYDDFVNHAY